MNPAALVFDLDGVLLDSESAWQEAITKAGQDSGGEWSEDARKNMNRHLAPEEWSSYIKKASGAKTNAKSLHQNILENLKIIYTDNLPIIKGAEETVTRLSEKYPLALATGSDREVVEVFLESSNLRDCFQETFAAEDTSNPKPHPEIYEKALFALKTRPRDALVIEDSDPGINAALAAGIPVACLLDENFIPEKETLARVSLIIREITTLKDMLLTGAEEKDALKITVSKSPR